MNLTDLHAKAPIDFRKATSTCVTTPYSWSIIILLRYTRLMNLEYT